MERKTCNIIRDVLPLYIDDVVCPDTKEWVEAQLAECPECAKAAEEMRIKPMLPINADVQLHNMDGMQKFKRLINKRWLKITAITSLCVVVAMIAAMCWMLYTVNIIEYDGSNIAIKETEDGYGLLLCYYGSGEVRLSWSNIPATGETEIVLTQSLWDLHISPMYDAPQTQWYLMETDRTLIVREQETGEILWEADEEQTARFYERQEKLKETNPEYFDVTGE